MSMFRSSFLYTDKDFKKIHEIFIFNLAFRVAIQHGISYNNLMGRTVF